MKLRLFFNVPKKTPSCNGFKERCPSAIMVVNLAGLKGPALPLTYPKNNIIYSIYSVEVSSAIATESIFSFGVIPEFQKRLVLSYLVRAPTT